MTPVAYIVTLLHADGTEHREPFRVREFYEAQAYQMSYAAEVHANEARHRAGESCEGVVYAYLDVRMEGSR